MRCLTPIPLSTSGKNGSRETSDRHDQRQLLCIYRHRTAKDSQPPLPPRVEGDARERHRICHRDRYVSIRRRVRLAAMVGVMLNRVCRPSNPNNASHARMAGPPVLQARPHSLRQPVPEPTLRGVAAWWIIGQLWVGATKDQETIGRSFFVRGFSTGPAIRASSSVRCVPSLQRASGVDLTLTHDSCRCRCGWRRPG